MQKEFGLLIPLPIFLCHFRLYPSSSLWLRLATLGSFAAEYVFPFPAFLDYSNGGRSADEHQWENASATWWKKDFLQTPFARRLRPEACRKQLEIPKP
jgi:hypothetical protein